jgi:hypothetical protein
VLFDGARDWLVGAASDSPVHRLDVALPVYGALTLLIAAVGTAAVLWRYRRIAA